MAAVRDSHAFSIRRFGKIAAEWTCLKSRREGVMKKLQALLVVVVTASLLSGGVPFPAQSLAAAAPGTAAAKPPATGWPRTFDRDGAHVVVYQPQLKSWQRYRELAADTAISITPTGAKQILGVISWSADTTTDVSARTVYIHDVHVLSSRFPSLEPAQEVQMQQRMQQIYPTLTLTIGLDRMIASLERVNSPASAVAVNTQPPPIFVSTVPAIVLLVDGKTVLAPILGSTLQYVVNTNWDLFYDNSNYYLLSGKTWLKAKELGGPWSVATKLPAEFAKLPAGQNWDEVLKAIPPATPAQPAAKVFFTEKPAELIAFKGKPAYLAIPGTQLAYASNTESSVFIHHPDDQVYALISGRWFRAANLAAPWVYAGNDLPADFAKIPRDHSYSAVLVSVPGTQEASDAVLLAQIPTTALVNRAAAEAQVKVSYAGDSKFVPIESTTLSYASNTPDKVIRVGDLYYLCFQGVWFRSTTPNGPWKTADSVPQVIYTIPPSSPVYNVTYVTVSNPTATTVETSYSSGYLGMFVVGMAVGAAVVYGTGYYYPPYLYWGPRPVYYPYPYTYGVAAVYNPYTGAYGVGRVVYGPYATAGSAAWYNPNTGMYGHAVTYQNAYGGHTYASAYNPWTGTYAATSQGHNQYSQWGSSVVTNGDNWAQAQHVTNANGTAASFQTSKGSAGAGFSGANGNSGFVAKDANNNNVYAGADGNVYKKDSNGDWSKWDNGSWTPVDPSTGAAQTKKQDHQQQNPTSSRQGANSQSQNLSGATAPSGQAGQRSAANGRETNQTTPAAQPRPAQPTQTPSHTSGASGTMGQLQNDANSRARGNQLEQQSRGGARGGSARGSGGGGRPHR
jgi:hypothetical protein